MGYQMLALDMDGTLLDRQLKISPKTVARIQSAREQGVQIVIATGRMFRAIVPYLKQLELVDDPAIVYNGAMVKSLHSKNPTAHHPLSLDAALQVANLVEGAGSQLNVYLDDLLYVRQRTPEVCRYMELTGVDSTVVGPIGRFFAENQLKSGPTKLLVIHDNLAEMEILRQRLRTAFGQILTITNSKPYFVEITAKNISKGTALAELAQLAGYSAKEVIAIGDSYNDLSMVKWAGLGVAVGNGVAELKEVADYVTSSCDQDGVAQVIEEFIL